MLMWSSLGCKRLLPDFTLIYCICCQFTAQLTILRDSLRNISCCIILTNGDFPSCVFVVEVTALLSLTSKNDLLSPLSDSYMYKNIWLYSYLIFFNLTSLKKKKRLFVLFFRSWLVFDACFDFRSDHQTLSDVFVQKGPYLKMYSTYIRQFDNNVALLDEQCRKNAAFAAVVREFEVKHIPPFPFSLPWYNIYMNIHFTGGEDTWR